MRGRATVNDILRQNSTLPARLRGLAESLKGAGMSKACSQVAGQDEAF